MDSNEEEMVLRMSIGAATTVIVMIKAWINRRRKQRRMMLPREPYETRKSYRNVHMTRILDGSSSSCVEYLRMRKTPFLKLAKLIRELGLLNDTIHVSVEEQLALFLHIVGHKANNRVMSVEFIRSGETVSRYFNRVLKAAFALRSRFMKQATGNTPPEIINNPLWYPYFEDCIGMIDGTHVDAYLPLSLQPRFKGPKGVTQNILAACTPDKLFTYILAGSEGATDDYTVLKHALSKPPPHGLCLLEVAMSNTSSPHHGSSADSPYQGKQIQPQLSAQQPGNPIPHSYGAFMLLPIMQPPGFSPNATGSLLPKPPCLGPTAANATGSLLPNPPCLGPITANATGSLLPNLPCLGPAASNATGASDKLLHSCDEENVHPSSKRSRFTARGPDSGNKIWQSYHDDKLIPYLAEQVKKGMKNGKTFKRPIFVEAANLINSEFHTNFSPENVENHMKALRSRYMNMIKCKKLSGNGWNAETNTATMDPQTYRAFELANPKLKDYVNKPLKWFDELSLIIGDDFATGSFCRSVFEEVPNSQSSPQINVLDDDETPVEVTQVISQEGGQTPHAKKSSMTQGSQRRNRKRASKQEDEFEGLVKACDRVMIAIEKASIGWGAQLEAKVREFGSKYPESFLDLAIETLFENEKVGKVFILKSRKGRESWLDSYAVECGVVDYEAGASRRGNIDGEV